MSNYSYDPNQTSPLLSNTNMDIRCIGGEALLCPFPQFTASQRSAMFASHNVQALPVHGAEHPKIFTGYESIFGRYEFNNTERSQDMWILDAIPKYPTNRGAHPIKENPAFTIIYRGIDDGKINYFILDKYTKGTDGYGYANKWMNTHLLTKDNYVTKDVKFSTSPSHIGDNMYALGVNANVAFVSFPEVNNDAFLISRSLAKKFTTTSVNTVELRISPNQVPLNLYGDVSEYRFLPDIGEKVRHDGILCGFRTPTDSTFISDMMESALVTPRPCHDALCYAPAGAVITDIDFYVNNKKKTKTNKELFAQVEKYMEPILRYWQRIVEVYIECRNKKYELAPAFNTLVTRAIAMLLANGVSVPFIGKRANMELVRKKEPIEFITVKLTYVYDRMLNLAFKSSDRYGCKGVVADIREDHEMPRDQYGFVCDLVIDPHAVNNRMNPGQLIEQDINRTSEFIRRTVEEKYRAGDVKGAYDYVIEYIDMINPNYCNMIVKPRAEQEGIDVFVEAVITEGIYLMIPPSLNTMGPDLIHALHDKYHLPVSPVTFYPRGIDGVPRERTTKCDVCIGAKYVMLLYTIPHAKSPGVAYINQFKVPVKPSSHNKIMHPVGQTPLRIGEDETRIMTMCSESSSVVRLMGIHANSFEAVKLMIGTLLRIDKPTTLDSLDMTTDRIVETNNVIGVAKHMMSTMGVDMENVTCEAFNETQFIRDLQS